MVEYEYEYEVKRLAATGRLDLGLNVLEDCDERVCCPCCLL